MIFISSICYNFLALNYTFHVMIKFLESFESKLPTFLNETFVQLTKLDVFIYEALPPP